METVTSTWLKIYIIHYTGGHFQGILAETSSRVAHSMESMRLKCIKSSKSQPYSVALLWMVTLKDFIHRFKT